jgi:hypothetical protein
MTLTLIIHPYYLIQYQRNPAYYHEPCDALSIIE